MQKRNFFWGLSISGILLVFLGIFAFRGQQANEENDKELMIITAACSERGKVVKAFISVNGEDYSEESFVQEELAPEGNFDFNPVLKLIK
ncbi:MAG: hypothetical protein AAFU64_17325, partial [Bacteroidota bacterium]